MEGRQKPLCGAAKHSDHTAHSRVWLRHGWLSLPWDMHVIHSRVSRGLERGATAAAVAVCAIQVADAVKEGLTQLPTCVLKDGVGEGAARLGYVHPKDAP
jgi:hypothetical protein